MKFKMFINYADSSSESSAWAEEYDREEVKTKEEAESFGRDIVKDFNQTLRSSERPRVFLRVEMIGESDIKHNWHKTNLVTIIDDHGSYDTYQCAVCGITGKRFGIGGAIIRDRRYRSEKYRFCKKEKP